MPTTFVTVRFHLLDVTVREHSLHQRVRARLLKSKTSRLLARRSRVVIEVLRSNRRGSMIGCWSDGLQEPRSMLPELLRQVRADGLPVLSAVHRRFCLTLRRLSL